MYFLFSSKIKSKYFTAGKKSIGGTYKKFMYYGYKDSDFKERLYRWESDKHLGFLGPVIRVEDNDVLQVTLFNNGSKPFSFYPYGLLPNDPKKVDKGGFCCEDWYVMIRLTITKTRELF